MVQGSRFGLRIPSGVRFVFRVPCSMFHILGERSSTLRTGFRSARRSRSHFLIFAYFDLRPFLGVILITFWFLFLRSYTPSKRRGYRARKGIGARSPRAALALPTLLLLVLSVLTLFVVPISWCMFHYSRSKVQGSRFEVVGSRF
jgi:hypothetical protein